ncbi:C40 family peptidase [Janibacter sp. GXQ6167]|uniref:C40 family peptidase n=1 Tax=Janibacter sp. GXQ6167 TaxID=3240791 RepID=UPI003524E7C3
MVDTIGRHRSPGGYSAINELTLVFGSITQPVAKTSAVLAASGGLVAAVALPASAAPSAPAAPVSAAPTAGSAANVAPAQAVTAPIPAAPVVQTTTADFGSVSVKAVAKPKPQPRPEPVAEPEATPTTPERTQTAPSRSNQRAATPATPAPAADPGDNLPAASGVVAIAKQYIGVPYVYGGSSPSGFDCSGFTSYVFAKVGKSLPRTAAAQQSAARPVSNPQPGDLVFFGAPAYHVGIYVGNGQMIDAPRTGMSVTVRPLFGGVSGYGRF